MAEADLSKIVGLIMENPELIKQIKGLADASGESTPETKAAEPTVKEAAAEKSEPVYINAGRAKSSRKDLLCALKPYVSSERAKAIDTMLSISDVLELMKTN